MASRGQTCNSSSLQTFPNPLLFSINSDQYISENPQPLNISFSSATRSSPPQFDNTGTGTLTAEPNNSSLRYLNYTYSLTSIQFTKPLHNSWIIPNSNQPSNIEDIVLTYSNFESISDIPQIIIINIPIIRSDSVTADSKYLAAIANPNIGTSNISIDSLFPNRENEIYAYYNICAQGYQTGDKQQNILSIIIVKGLNVSNSTMNQILLAFNQVSNTYGRYQSPITFSFSSQESRGFDNTLFSKYVKHGYNLTTVVPASSSITSSTMASRSSAISTTAATAATAATPRPPLTDMNKYKCMPLNPDKDISNGQLMINPKTGQPYSDINAEREALKAEATTSDTKPFFSEEKFVTAISKFMAFIIAGTILMILFFLLFAPSVPGEYSSGFAKFLYLFVGLPLELIMIIIAGMIGYVIGMSSS